MDDLQTIKDFIRWGASSFEAAKVGCVSPYNDAYSLIQHAIHLKKIPDRLLDAKLDKGEIETIYDLFKKRAKGKMPVPYIINKAVFAGKSFYVDKRVLIPRSPIQLYFTEKNEGTKWLPFLKHKLKQEPKRILDLCTGSGCIGIIAALVFPEAIVDLSDISKDALEVACININRYNLNDRVHVIESDLLENIPGRYDLILCNPPYVSKKEMAELKREISEHQPIAGLYGGLNGLDHVTKILTDVGGHIINGGMLLIEIAQYKGPLIKPPFFNIKWSTPLKSCPTVFVIPKGEFKE